MTLNRLNPEHLIFLDIETVPLHADFSSLTQQQQQLWADKTAYQRKEELTAEEYYERAGIWAEFGKIVCISLGYFQQYQPYRSFRVTSFWGEEHQILSSFKNLLERHFNKSYYLLCAHNGKEFDFPYIARRMLINRIDLPEKLMMFGKKPWEIPHIDTMELWKFGDYKHYTSLKLLANVLDIPSPKDDIDGSQVRDVFYKDKDIDRIVTYCEKDTVTVAQVFLRLRNEDLLTEEEVTFV